MTSHSRVTRSFETSHSATKDSNSPSCKIERNSICMRNLPPHTILQTGVCFSMALNIYWCAQIRSNDFWVKYKTFGIECLDTRPLKQLLLYFCYVLCCRYNTLSHQKRWDHVRQKIEKGGTYELTTSELTFGAKTAWRNAPKCIGRIQWSKLQVCKNITLFTK